MAENTERMGELEAPSFKAIPTDALQIVESHTGDLKGIFVETARRLDGLRWQHYLYPLTVISSVCIEDDLKPWLHVSLAHQKRMPNYEEIKMVKEMFIGRDRYAVMVFPPADKFVNIHKTCLHLWHCLEEWPLPEFSGFLKGGTRSV